MKPCLNPLGSVLNRVFQGALPDNSHAPPKSTEPLLVANIAVDISLEFSLPEIHVGLRSGGVATAFMPMPETAVNEYYSPVLREHEVGAAWQLLHM